jgi:serine/threonine protein kinase
LADLFLSEFAISNLKQFVLKLKPHHKIVEQTYGMFGILGIALDIAFGIVAVHSHGLAHCDIKPDNCLVLWTMDNQPVVKLCDFGSLLKVEREGLKRIPKSKGTVGYAPDEAVSRKYGLKTDVYSLAMTIVDLAQCGYNYEGSVGSEKLSLDRKDKCPPGCEDLWKVLERALMPYEARSSLPDMIYDITLLCKEFTRSECRKVMAQLWKTAASSS